MTDQTPDAPLTAASRAVRSDLTERVVGKDAAPAHHSSDTLLDYTMIGNRRLPFPLYTTVFLVLGVLTIIEIAIAETLPRELFITFILLFGISLVKAVLVVYFYMHLRDDNRIFAAALALPVFVALIAMLFLAVVPPTGY